MAQDEDPRVRKDFESIKDQKKACYMPISLLFNMSLCNLMLSMRTLNERINKKNSASRKDLHEEGEDSLAYLPHAEAALDLCQEMITRIFLPNRQLELAYKSKAMHEELAVIGTDSMKQKILRLLDGLKSVLCDDVHDLAKYGHYAAARSAQSARNQDQEESTDGDAREFKRLLLDDMRTWVREAFLNLKL